MRKIRKDETESEHEERLKRKKIWYDKNKLIILARERNRYKKKKISDMKEKMKLMEQNIALLEKQMERNITLLDGDGIGTIPKLYNNDIVSINNLEEIDLNGGDVFVG